MRRSIELRPLRRIPKNLPRFADHYVRISMSVLLNVVPNGQLTFESLRGTFDISLVRMRHYRKLERWGMSETYDINR